MSEATLKAVGSLDAATPDTISHRDAEARATIDKLAALGIDLSNVGDVLEREGIASFVQNWEDVIASVEQQVKNAGADVLPAGAVKPASRERATSTAPAAAAPAETDKATQV